MATHKVRTVFQPGKVQEVDDAELADLRAMKAIKEMVSEEKAPAASEEKNDAGAVSTPKKK